MPSTEANNFLSENINLHLNNLKLKINIYNTSLGQRWLETLKDNLRKKRILEKNFCFLGWADSSRDLRYLVSELNDNISQINSFAFDPPYNKIGLFCQDDFQYSDRLPIGSGKENPGKRLKHEACNLSLIHI